VRIARICTEGGDPRAAVERDGGLHPFGADLGALLHGGAPEAAENPVARASQLAPVAPGKVVAIGLNYLDHIRESGLERPEEPLIFAKFPSSVIGPDEVIRLPLDLTRRVDWEVELAVVIGARARNVAPQDALGKVFGYTVANDVSARDLQFADGQWVRAKSLDTFCPLGPVVVTADEIPDPQRLHLVCRVNGEVMQDATTDLMVFGVAELISHCSRSFTSSPATCCSRAPPGGAASS
jgi:2-keto-4-pentenoate hydratase/2-oxohepta-3-ene-1,7-dioic acid hydratase in catechol pathway